MTREEVYEEAKRRQRELNSWFRENGINYCSVLIQKQGEDKAQSFCAIDIEQWMAEHVLMDLSEKFAEEMAVTTMKKMGVPEEEIRQSIEETRDKVKEDVLEQMKELGLPFGSEEPLPPLLKRPKPGQVH